MKFKIWLTTVCILIIASLSFLFLFRDEWVKKVLEWQINKNTKPFFSEVQIKNLHLTPDLKLSIEQICAKLKTKNALAPVSITINHIYSEKTIFKTLDLNGVELKFEELKPVQSRLKGINGSLRISVHKKWFVDLKADVSEIGLEEIEWVNVENLQGSEGVVFGTMSVFLNFKNDVKFDMDLHSAKPGKIRARFLSNLMNYLPQNAQDKRLKEVATKKDLVQYETADVQMRLVSASEMKVLLHILIPEYNLNLNLNITLRVDQENAFMQVAQLLKLLKTS